MFIDKIKIKIKAGNGGDGFVGFHREKYVNQGGPDGGDGGRGGSIVFETDEGTNTLVNFRYKRKFHAQNGAHGMGGNKFGKYGEDLIIRVPQGTIVREISTGKIIADMFEKDQQKVLLKGGYVGKGNARFATPTRQTPDFATPGQKTQEIEVQLELKTIADAGLIGMPNVGKSTLLSVLTAAKPKIANYHFTTLAPNLGVVSANNYSFVLADIPGLIEGAAQGIGLGHDFLRHVERTRMLLHVIDMSGSEERDPIQDYLTINKELSEYSEKLGGLLQIVLANKMDIPAAQENLEKFNAFIEDINTRNTNENGEQENKIVVMPVSAATVSGLDSVVYKIIDHLKALPPIERFIEEELELQDRKSFEIVVQDGTFIVSGPAIDIMLNKTNSQDYDSLRHFQKMLISAGVIDALRKEGIKQGDTVVMSEWEFDFVD